MSERRKPVFFDHSGKRWSSIIRLAFWFALIFSIVGAVFSFSLIVLPSSPISLALHPMLHSKLSVPRLISKEEAARHVIENRSRDRLLAQMRLERAQRRKARLDTAAPYSTAVGFYVNWDAQSLESVRNHIKSLTYVVPEWLYLDFQSPKLFKDRSIVPKKPTDRKEPTNLNESDKELIRLARQNNVPILPLIHNLVGQFDGGTPGWNWDRLRKLLLNPAAQQKLAENLRDYVIKNNFGGINIDFEPGFKSDSFSPAQYQEAERLMHDELPHFMNRLGDVFHKSHLLVTQDIPARDQTAENPDGTLKYREYDYAALNGPNDWVVFMLYDEHSDGSNPGTIASQPWVEDMAQQIFEKMDSSKVVLGIGNYCYDWPISRDKNGNAVEDSFVPGELAKVTNTVGKLQPIINALHIADSTESAIDMDEEDLNPYFPYVDTDGQNRVVFMLDATTAYNQIMALKGYQPRGAALWRLGSEDPSIWSFFGEDKLGKPIKATDIAKLKYPSQVGTVGDGEIKDLVADARDGRRTVTFDRDGLISSETFSEYPSPYVQASISPSPGLLALTFDDGPDPKYTPEILKVLEKHKVPGTFFVVGQNADRYPGIVRECWESGSEIGNHTFTHPHILDVSNLRAKMEINATQRAIESITGHSSKLFRAPWGEGDNMDERNKTRQGEFLHEVQSMGYLVVDMNIDAWDWDPDTNPTAQSIVDKIVGKWDYTKNPSSPAALAEFTKHQADYGLIYSKGDNKLTQNNVILLHDAGGNRDRTVKALDLLIPILQKKGFKFVRVSELVGPGEHDKLFPMVAHSQETFAGFDRVMFELGFGVTSIFELIFLLSILLGVGRVAVVSILALIQARQSGRKVLEDYKPRVSVIIPGFNEERVICQTIRSVLDSDYSNMQVIVVDDGSLDQTAKVVTEEFSSDPRVTFVTKENGGKSSALNLGISKSDSEIIVCLDADTIFAKDTISRLVTHFADKRVGAVAGNVKVGNRTNPLTIWQSVEYITSQNFDRRAYAALNSVSVVPGAVGAWRKSAILEAGGYSTDTLAEDTDLTFRVRLLGYHIRTENEALAFTEAPDTVRALAKQRFRWAFGTLQSLWKHRHILFKPKHGAFSMFVMPAMWIYNIFLQAFAPVVDIAVIMALVNLAVSFHSAGASADAIVRAAYHDAWMVLAFYYAAFFILDLIGAMIAVQLDHEDPKQLVWLFWQRFFYRQFMYYVILKSILAALKGGIVGWGKLHRKASVSSVG